MRRKVLYVDDDAGVRAALRVVLSSAGYECKGAASGAEALDAVTSFGPDLVVLDVMLPDLNGFEVCERIRSINPSVSVLFLSAKGDVGDRKEGLRCGADDYMAKPFDQEELLLRCAVLLRRSSAGTTARDEASDCPELRAGEVYLHLVRRECLVRGEKVQLTPLEFKILAYLMARIGQPVSSEELVHAVWGDDWTGEPTGVAVYMRRIRGKIELDPSHPEYLQTVWGVGYRFDVP